jgi:hypothetical protein
MNTPYSDSNVFKGLVHGDIDPASKFLSELQWHKYSVDILENC